MLQKHWFKSLMGQTIYWHVYILMIEMVVAKIYTKPI